MREYFERSIHLSQEPTQESGDTTAGKADSQSSAAVAPMFAAVSDSTPIFVQIAGQLIKAIEGGELPLGSRLPSEMALSKQFGVSRASVREALSSLQFSGYIESRRGSGSIVCSVHSRGTDKLWEDRLTMPANIIDLLEARLLVEPETIRQAALNPHPPALAKLKQLLEGMELSIDYPELNARTDIGIHLVLVQTCHNPFLAQASEQLLLHSEGHLWRTIRDRAWDEGTLPRTWLGHHEMIARAVTAHDPDLAETAMRVHLLSVLQNVIVSTSLSEEGRRRACDIHSRYAAFAQE